MAADPLKDPEKYAKIPHPEDAADPAKTRTTLLSKLTGKPSGDAAAKSGVPLGMGSALAAVTEGDAPRSGPDAAFGIDANSPNAFSEVRTGKYSSSPNAFSEAPPPPAAAEPAGHRYGVQRFRPHGQSPRTGARPP